MASEQSYLTTLEAAGDWTNESNLTGAGDDSCAIENAGNSYTGYYSMSFSSVEGTINGIEVTVHSGANDSDDYLTVELTDSIAGVVTQNTVALGTGYSICANCNDKTVGDSTDLWGGTWTPAHIKSSSFQLRLRAKAAGKSGGGWMADNVSVTVYYTPAADGEQVMVID